LVFPGLGLVFLLDLDLGFFDSDDGFSFGLRSVFQGTGGGFSIGFVSVFLSAWIRLLDDVKMVTIFPGTYFIRQSVENHRFLELLTDERF
jgi:hypothetical protein